MGFFDENLLLTGDTARGIYKSIADLPIIDYHCHLNEADIKNDKKFSDIGELWLSGDHYKWRAMRLCGVDESYITGDRSYEEKFLKYAKIMPKLFGNPLYYWTHMELKQIFGISEPLNEDSASRIYEKANEILQGLSVQKLLEKFRVEYIATTDDPFSDLSCHGDINGVKVRPTFRPDRCFSEGVDKVQLEKRLDYFVSKGCKIADHGFDDFSDTQNIEWLIENALKGSRFAAAFRHFPKRQYRGV